VKTFTVKLSNTGKSKLYIRRIDAASPLTVGNAPKEINAGASADINITYNTAGQSGVQNKSITVVTNDPKNAKITLRLRADVTD
jgi:hypothetical protein